MDDKLDNSYMEHCIALLAADASRKSFTATSLFSFFLSNILLLKRANMVMTID